MSNLVKFVSVMALVGGAALAGISNAEPLVLDSENPNQPPLSGVIAAGGAVAKGSVDVNGNLYNDQYIQSVVWNSSSTRWEITLVGGISYYYLDFVPNVTPYGASHDYSVQTDSFGGKMIVSIYENGSRVKGLGFSFTIRQ